MTPQSEFAQIEERLERTSSVYHSTSRELALAYIRHRPGSVIAWTILGNALSGLVNLAKVVVIKGEFAEARRHLQRALRLGSTIRAPRSITSR